MSGIGRISAERKRQRSRSGERYSAKHDDTHRSGELALAAAVYATPPNRRDGSVMRILWPGWCYKPSEDRLHELAKAGALIAAEIDRLERLSANAALAAQEGDTDG